MFFVQVRYDYQPPITDHRPNHRPPTADQRLPTGDHRSVPTVHRPVTEFWPPSPRGPTFRCFALPAAGRGDLHSGPSGAIRPSVRHRRRPPAPDAPPLLGVTESDTSPLSDSPIKCRPRPVPSGRRPVISRWSVGVTGMRGGRPRTGCALCSEL